MGEFKDLNKIYNEYYNKNVSPSTICKWVKDGKLKAFRLPNNRWDYDINSFLEIINDDNYKKSLKSKKQNPNNYIGKKSGYLIIKNIVPEEDKTKGYLGTEMYCDCLRCGKKNIKIRFTYLNDNGNYQQKSCGCYKEIRHYLACCRDGITEDFLEQYSINFNRYRFINTLLTHLKSKYYLECSLEEYKAALDYFYKDEQFNRVYDFWEMHKQENSTFYDWAKPSLDHIIPISRGGSDCLDNLQILTVFENFSKRDLTMEEWNLFKKENKTTSNYYIENIMNEVI